MAVNLHWPVAVALEALPGEAMGTISAEEVKAAKVIIRAELERLNGVKCHGCGGPGHNADCCETSNKLSWISVGGVAQAAVMKQILTTVNSSMAHAAQPAGGQSRLPRKRKYQEFMKTAKKAGAGGGGHHSDGGAYDLLSGKRVHASKNFGV